VPTSRRVAWELLFQAEKRVVITGVCYYHFRNNNKAEGRIIEVGNGRCQEEGAN
jgi:hypothetical protein